MSPTLPVLQEALDSLTGSVLFPRTFLNHSEKTIGHLSLRQNGGLFPRGSEKTDYLSQPVSLMGLMRGNGRTCLRTDYESAGRDLESCVKLEVTLVPLKSPLLAFLPFFNLAEPANIQKLLPESARLFVSGYGSC